MAFLQVPRLQTGQTRLGSFDFLGLLQWDLHLVHRHILDQSVSWPCYS